MLKLARKFHKKIKKKKSLLEREDTSGLGAKELYIYRSLFLGTSQDQGYRVLHPKFLKYLPLTITNNLNLKNDKKELFSHEYT